MKTFKLFIASLLLAVVMVMTSHKLKAQTKQQPDPLIEVRKVIAESNAIYFQAFVKNDVLIFTERYADDACIMAPFVPSQCGKENAVQFFRDAYDNYGMRNGNS